MTPEAGRKPAVLLMDLDSSTVIVVDPAANQNMKALTFLQKISLANKQKWHYNNILGL